MAGELLRKSIHLSSLGVPLIYWFVTQKTMLTLLVPATGISILIEIARRTMPRFDERFRALFGPILRPHERVAAVEGGPKPEINGATFVLVAATISVAIFPKTIAMTAFTVLIISDTAAALIGRRFGRRRIGTGRFRDKSIEGSLAFFLSALGVLLFFGLTRIDPSLLGSFLVAGAVASLLATFVEIVSSGGSTVDDNLTIPIAFGAVQWFLVALIEGQL